MNLGDLKIFATVVRQGGITRAPERLHRVQSNVTTRIPQLEDELGVPLFIREWSWRAHEKEMPADVQLDLANARMLRRPTAGLAFIRRTSSDRRTRSDRKTGMQISARQFPREHRVVVLLSKI